MRTGPSSPKNREIQILRGISIAFVLIQHYGPTLPVPLWYYRLMDVTSFRSGVDLFFVISGFVISRSIASLTGNANCNLGRAALRSFWTRRAFRLMPAAWLWAVIAVCTGFFVASMDFMQPWLIAKGAISGMLGYSNYLWASCLSQHAVGISCPNLYSTSVYWSLSLEEQFYAVLSLMLLVLPLRAVALCGVVAAFALHVAGDGIYIYFFRFGAMVAGVCLYWLTTTDGYRASWGLISRTYFRRMLLLASIAIVALAPSISQQHTIPIVTAAAFVAVWICSYDATLSVSKFWRCIEWLGDRSYSLYLCHLPVFIVVRELIMRNGAKGCWDSAALVLGVVPIAIGAALLAADLTYRLVELPFAKRGRAISEHKDRAEVQVSPVSIPPTHH